MDVDDELAADSTYLKCSLYGLLYLFIFPSFFTTFCRLSTYDVSSFQSQINMSANGCRHLQDPGYRT